MPNRESIINTIRTLLAHTTERGCGEQEAETAFAKAQQLMERYQIELYDLHQDDPIGETVSPMYQSGPPGYKSDIHVALAYYYGGQAIITGTAKHWVVKVIGPESVRITCEIMIEFVWAQVHQKARDVVKQLGYYNQAQAVRHVAKALRVRISNETQRKRQEPAQAGTSFSLVTVDAIKNWVLANYPDLKPGRATTIKNLSAAAVQAAKGINLNHQVTARNLPRLT